LPINPTRTAGSLATRTRFRAVSATLPPEAGARRSLRRRLAEGPIARRVALVDLRLYRLLREDLHHPGVARGVRAFSNTGEHAALWHAIAVGGVALDGLRRPRWRRAALAIGATQAANSVLKLVAHRTRPAFDDLPALVRTPTQLSFPSGHASSSFAAARALSALLPARPLYATATAMSVSRVYLGVHYPTDIAVGAVLGTLVGSAGR
jgi:undecaprenyl-diphosphatase